MYVGELSAAAFPPQKNLFCAASPSGISRSRTMSSPALLLQAIGVESTTAWIVLVMFGIEIDSLPSRTRPAIGAGSPAVVSRQTLIVAGCVGLAKPARALSTPNVTAVMLKFELRP